MSFRLLFLLCVCVFMFANFLVSFRIAPFFNIMSLFSIISSEVPFYFVMLIYDLCSCSVFYYFDILLTKSLFSLVVDDVAWTLQKILTSVH